MPQLNWLERLGAKEIHAEARRVRELGSLRTLIFAFCVNNDVSKTDVLAALPALESAHRGGFSSWPAQIAALVRGADVLDVGCGHTLYGVAMRAAGAASYVGIDGRLDLGRRHFSNPLTKQSVASSVSLREAAQKISALQYEPRVEIHETQEYDVVTLRTVTEHLRDIDATFSAVSRALRPGGQLWFLHDNYHSWSGHHLGRNNPAATHDSARNVSLLDGWHHVDFEPPSDHYIARHLNRIRLDELRAITAHHFEICTWTELADTARVAGRLTPAVRSRLGGFTRRELLTKHVICCATKRVTA